MNAFAAFCDATSRLGWTSVARMLPETSIARITVCCCDGSVTTAVGRAMPMINAASDSSSTAGGTWRRQRAPGAIAPLTMARLARRRAVFLRLSSQI